MRKFNSLFIIVFSFICITNVSCAKRNINLDFIDVKPIDVLDGGITCNAFKFNINGSNYIITDASNLSIEKKDKLIDLPIESTFAITAIKYLLVKNNLLIVYEISDTHIAPSYIAAIELKTLKLIWNASTGGFNIGQPLYFENSIFTSSIGTISKINSKTGKVVWSIKDLSDDIGHFNYFAKPRIEENKVIFEEDLLGRTLKDKKVKYVEVDIKSGKVLGVYSK